MQRDHMPDQGNNPQVYRAAACVAISTQIEAAMKACEEETSKLGQDYYTALAANSPGPAAKRPPSASTGPAPAKSKAGKDNPAAAAEVQNLMTVVASCGEHRHMQNRHPGTIASDTQISHTHAQS